MERKFLVVEDEKDQVLIWTTAFNRRGYTIDAAYTGHEAIQKIRGYTNQNVPDGFLVDICLPGESGFDVIRAIRANPITTDRPIITVTATTQYHLSRAVKEGANYAFLKPFNLRNILDTMDELVERQRTITR